MTMYLQTKTDMFAAAASHAGISNVTSYWGEGYWGYSYNSVAAADSYPWNNPDLFTNTEHCSMRIKSRPRCCCCMVRWIRMCLSARVFSCTMP